MIPDTATILRRRYAVRCVLRGVALVLGVVAVCYSTTVLVGRTGVMTGFELHILPTIAAFLGFASPALVLGAGSERIARWIVPGAKPACPECGYSLDGARAGRCPECGGELPAEVLSRVPARSR